WRGVDSGWREAASPKEAALPTRPVPVNGNSVRPFNIFLRFMMSYLYVSDAIHLHQRVAGYAALSYGNSGTYRGIFPETAFVYLVHALVVCNIIQEHGDFQHFFHGRTGFYQFFLQCLQYNLGMRFNFKWFHMRPLTG